MELYWKIQDTNHMSRLPKKDKDNQRGRTMKRYDAHDFTDNEIILKHDSELEELFKTIDSEENFILTWGDPNTPQSQIIIGNNITGKVKSGNIILRAHTTE